MNYYLYRSSKRALIAGCSKKAFEFCIGKTSRRLNGIKTGPLLRGTT